jgi:hypothetical protein
MDLRVDTGTVYDIPYHTVQPLFGSERMRIDAHGNWTIGDPGRGWMDMEEWCGVVFGKPSIDGVWTPGRRWYMNNSKFWFRDQGDLTMFILRWS